MVLSQGEADSAGLEHQQSLLHLRQWQTQHTLSELLLPFTSLTDTQLLSPTSSDLLGEPLPLELTEWARTHFLDLGTTDLLNAFCEQLRLRQWEGLESPCLSPGLSPSMSPGMSPHPWPSLQQQEEPKVVLPQSTEHLDDQ